MRKVLFSLTGVAIAAGMAVPASAQTAYVGGPSSSTSVSPGNSFSPESITTSFSNLMFQYGTLMATGAGTFSFSYLGNESGWRNEFRVGSSVLTETSLLGSTVTLSVVGSGNPTPLFTFVTTDPANPNTASNGQTFTNDSNPSFAIISNSGGGNVLTTLGGPGFQYVLGFNDAYSGDRDFDDYLVGVNFVAAPVPEPSTYALMLAGLGAVGWMARRRRRAV